jgi:rod shape determining protein RodA
MKHVWTITVVLIILSILSLFNILSFDILPDGQIEISDIFVKQLLFISIGWIVYTILSKSHYSIFKFTQTNIIIYILTIVLLVSTLIWGPVINNTQRWLLFGDFQFQPSELAKITLILLMACIFGFKHKLGEWKILLISLALLLPMLAVIYMQPHGSMSLILLLIWLFLLLTVMPNQVRNLILGCIVISGIAFVLALALREYTYAAIFFISFLVFFTFTFYAREAWRKLSVIALGFGLLMGVLASLTWHSLLLDYQKERINTFLSPTENTQDLGFNVDQSRVAIGSGRIFGKGWGFGTQSKLHFLPEHKTDFIFATFSEEFGLVGSVTLILLYFFIIFRILIFAFKYEKMNFEFVFLIGIAIKMFLEVFINIGTNTGVIPATGIPLPIMSYGGTSILLTFFSLGLVQSIIGHTMSNIKEESIHDVDNKRLLL